MARKRTPDQESATETPHEAAQDTATAVAHSHVAALGREPGDEPVRQPRSNPHSEIVDSIVGVTYQRKSYGEEGNKKYFAEIIFRDGKPPEEARQAMKIAGFKFDFEHPEDNTWFKPIGFNTQERDKVTAKSAAYKVIDIMRKERGIESASQDVPAF